jgi:hypothetical protein
MIGPTDAIIPHYLKNGKQTEGIKRFTPCYMTGEGSG